MLLQRVVSTNCCLLAEANTLSVVQIMFFFYFLHFSVHRKEACDDRRIFQFCNFVILVVSTEVTFLAVVRISQLKSIIQISQS